MIRSLRGKMYVSKDCPCGNCPISRSHLSYTLMVQMDTDSVSLHQLDDEEVERLILFRSKWLTKAEKNYWPTELEIATLVWGIQWSRQYFDGNRFTVYVDHSAILNLFQGTSPHRKNQRLTPWSFFVSQFSKTMIVVHRLSIQSPLIFALQEGFHQ